MYILYCKQESVTVTAEFFHDERVMAELEKRSNFKLRATLQSKRKIALYCRTDSNFDPLSVFGHQQQELYEISMFCACFNAV